MRHRSSNRSVIVSLVASLVVHALVIVPLLLAMFAAGGASPRVEALFSSEALRQLNEEAQRQESVPALGLESSIASTLTWIGYEEYLEHLAQLSEIEQAAFTEAPTGIDLPSEEPVPLVEPVDQFADAGLAEVVEGVETAAAESMEDPVGPVMAEVGEAEGAVEPQQPLVTMEIPAVLPEIYLARISRIFERVGLLSRDHDEGESAELVETEVEREEIVEIATGEREVATAQVEGREASEPAESNREATDRQERVESEEPVRPVMPQRPVVSEPPGEPADSADKQSDPTSVIEVSPAHWRLGRPLAGRGIELKPQRPHFSLVQRLTASPCNPLVEMRFNRAGRVTEVMTIEGTRDSSVDAAIVASAYRWRAVGALVESLKDEETFAVRIRFILNPYARCP